MQFLLQVSRRSRRHRLRPLWLATVRATGEGSGYAIAGVDGPDREHRQHRLYGHARAHAMAERKIWLQVLSLNSQNIE